MCGQGCKRVRPLSFLLACLGSWCYFVSYIFSLSVYFSFSFFFSFVFVMPSLLKTMGSSYILYKGNWIFMGQIFYTGSKRVLGPSCLGRPTEDLFCLSSPHDIWAMLGPSLPFLKDAPYRGQPSCSVPHSRDFGPSLGPTYYPILGYFAACCFLLHFSLLGFYFFLFVLDLWAWPIDFYFP